MKKVEISKLFKYLFIFFIVIIFFIIILNASVIAPANQINSYNFLPAGNVSFIYFKNFQTVKNQYLKSDFANKLKDNYIYLDFKYKYSQDINLFFIKYNLNIEKLADLVKRDLIIAKYDKEYFLITSINFTTKIIYSVLNILPQEEIKEFKYNNRIINVIKKNNGFVYFSVIEDYLLIAGDSNIIQSMIDAYSSKEKIYKNDLYKLCDNSDVYIDYKLEGGYNKYKLLPDIMDISIKISAKDFNAKLYATPGTNSPFVEKNAGFKDLNVLKYFNKDFSLNYYTGYTAISDIINPLINNYKISGDDKEESLRKEKVQNDLEVFNNFYTGAYFGLNGFQMLNRSNNIVPEICTVIKVKDEVNAGNIDEITKKILNVYSFLFGIDGWDKETSSYEKFKGKNSDFSIIRYQKYFFFIFGNDFSNDVAKRISNPQPSLYDKFYDKIKDNSSSFFVCLNSGSISKAVEPIFKEYLAKKVNLNKDEYDNSFGQLFSYMKDSDSVFVNLIYDNKSKLLTGNLEYVK